MEYKNNDQILQAKARLNELIKKLEADNATTDECFTLCMTCDYLRNEPEYAELKKYEEMAVKALENDVNSAHANDLVSLIYNLKNNPQKALFYISRAIELQPNEVRYYLSRASLYEKLGQKRNAKADEKVAKKLDPVYYNKQKKEMDMFMLKLLSPVIIAVVLTILVFILNYFL